MNEKHIARIENGFIMDAHYNLSVIEQKIILLLVSRINPIAEKNDNPIVQRVSLHELKKILLDGRNKKIGSLSAYMEMVRQKLEQRKIYPNKDSMIGDFKVVGGHIKWFSSILYLERGNEKIIEFIFSYRMKPYLLELTKYVQLDVVEIMKMTNIHAIRLYQILKATRDKRRGHEDVSIVDYGLIDLRALLGLTQKYKENKSFKRAVLEKIKVEINKHSNYISVEYDFLKKGRAATGVRFFLSDKENVKKPRKKELADYIPTESDIAKLTRAKKAAYDKLVDFGVKEGIAIKRIIPTITGSESVGFEDIFVKKAIDIYNEKGKGKVGAFVKWWHEKKVFDSKKGEQWTAINEHVISYKKGLSKERRTNRGIAKTMTDNEFKVWYRSSKSKKSDQAAQLEVKMNKLISGKKI